MKQHFKPEDFDLSQYNLYFKEYNLYFKEFENSVTNGVNESTFVFQSTNDSLDGLQSLNHDLKLVDKIYRATHSKNKAVIKHLEELEILLQLAN